MAQFVNNSFRQTCKSFTLSIWHWFWNHKFWLGFVLFIMAQFIIAELYERSIFK
jgi:hypothetical protein